MTEILRNRTVSNPLNEEFRFQWDKVEYVIPPLSTMSYVGYLAIHAAKKLADKILREKGRFSDVVRNDKIIGHAVGKGERQAVAKAILDREDEFMDLDEITDKAKNAVSKKRKLPVGDVVAVIAEKPVGTVKTKETEAAKEVAPDLNPVATPVPEVAPDPGAVPSSEKDPEPIKRPKDIAEEASDFKALKEKGWISLDKEERSEYSRLKKMFNK